MPNLKYIGGFKRILPRIFTDFLKKGKQEIENEKTI